MVIDRAQSRSMDAMGEESAPSAAARGKEIRRRRIRLGIKSYEQFHQETGVSRKAITAAENGTAGATTYERLEDWLDRFEEETGSDDPAGRRDGTEPLSGDEMPEGYEWAVVYLDAEVWLLVQRLDVLTLNTAPVEVVA